VPGYLQGVFHAGRAGKYDLDRPSRYQYNQSVAVVRGVARNILRAVMD